MTFQSVPYTGPLPPIRTCPSYPQRLQELQAAYANLRRVDANQPSPKVTSKDELRLWLASLCSALNSHRDACRAVLAANPHHVFPDPDLQDVIHSLAGARIRVSAKLE
ncbi:hypothetical protein BOTBODRAFT_39988 [Botryobasidium botryosum FD-172 SS1]|uniref:Uncharacterized protein n=1 Tax=Botryobasidium botryosum (strain FD-172 SS1) TaxID=930990 RepID=A0A067LTW2_BOTB1|nr:hypothetical protein BOTBODRAFT_39988 [Botryobasidium botryosum FD-172 SS1]